MVKFDRKVLPLQGHMLVYSVSEGYVANEYIYQMNLYQRYQSLLPPALRPRGHLSSYILFLSHLVTTFRMSSSLQSSKAYKRLDATSRGKVHGPPFI